MNETKYEIDRVSHFRVGAFATGAYLCRCDSCKREFHGDKRASLCLKCQNDRLNEMGTIFAQYDADTTLMIKALRKIIKMNRQEAFDKYGDHEKAEEWACVKVARAALPKEL